MFITALINGRYRARVLPNRLWVWGGVLLATLLAVIGRPAPSSAVITFTPSGFIEEVVASGLPFATGITFAPDGRMFIALKSGVVRVYQNGTLLPTPFVDISAQVNDFNDRGLLGITLHPDFPNTPYVYLLFTWNPPGFSVNSIGARVSRLIRVEADPAQGYNVAMPGSAQTQTTPGGPGHVILLGTNSTAANIGDPVDGRNQSKASCMTGLSMAGAPIEDCIPSDEDSHSIGTVMFGVDGSLFAGSGDGSDYTAVDVRALRAQNVNSLAGKIMRIDPTTGLGLPDNPFFDPTCPQCNRSKIYALGLRNPFRFTIHPDTNEPFIGDVGWSTWEEVNTGKGANFGWPCYEGGAAGGPPPVESGTTTSLQTGGYQSSSGTVAVCGALYAQGLAAVRASVFSYNHTGTDGAGGSGGASVNGGTFYEGTVYPPQYQNALFILDYNRLWIRYLTFDAQGRATVNNFGRESASGMVQVLTGPDTNLYVVVFSGAGGQVRRIRYVGAGNTPPTAVASAAPTIGTVPLTVNFSSLGSFDPDNQPLSYSWSFGDGFTSTQQHPTHTYTGPGVYTATLTLTELTTPFATRTDTVVITVGNEPPLASIAAPPDGTSYRIGDTITYSGSGSAGGTPLPASQLSWELRLHHNQHIHYTPLPDGAGGTFDVIEHGDDTFYEVCLTATVDETLNDTQCVSLLPETTPITLTTEPAGLFVNYEDEGLTQASPMIVHPVVGAHQTVSVQAIQGGRTFNGWTDGVPSTSHPFVVDTTPATYTARYINQPPVAVAAANPLNGNAPLTVAFTGSGSSDPEFGTLTYSWDFGDGQASTQTNPVHVYSASGTFQAVLTVTDQLNGTASQTRSIVVNPASPLCGNGLINPGEACDGGACCTSGCQFAPAVTVCRAAAGVCDVAESCTGASAACPANVLAGAGVVCRAAAGVCDLAESCTGASATCPADVLVAAGVACRTAAGVCDVAESCSGSAPACPANGFVPNGTSCSDGNACNGSEVCQAGSCTAGSAPVCNDGIVCTTDTCNPPTGCVFTNNTVPCNDGVACTTDACSGGVCVGTSTCAAGETCNLSTGSCSPAGGFKIWPDTTVPALVDAGPDSSVELGVRFSSDQAGFITAIRFYKSSLNTGTHVGNLWSNSGTLLATATFSNESASGWQQVSLSPPVAIAANTVYVASYRSPNGHYSGNVDYFATQGVDSPPLHALADGVSGANGVYGYGAVSSFPNNTFRSANYWVDVAFNPQAPATLTSIAVTPANPTVTPGGTVQFTATGTYSDASVQNLTSQVTWASSSSAVATISAAGLATAVAGGTTTISATLGAVSGSTVLTVPSGGLTITTLSLPLGKPATPYTATLAASGATPPYTWALLSGSLPTGLTLNGSTGVISGTPTASGVSNFTVRVTAGAQNGTRALTISVGPNAIAAENALSGNPASEWDVSGAGDFSIQGFATDISVNRGGTINFKISTTATNYRVDIYRLGYYGGLGARLVATVQPSVTLPQSQPACLTDSATGLVDCGNWTVSASWSVPAFATSGIYIARPVRSDTQGASHIPFVVRDDDGGSDLLFQTSDTTWQAYNTYGGNSLYLGSPVGRAYKVSYNRPITTRCCDFPNGAFGHLFNAEYPMVRWLERNGYNVSYTSGVDTDRRGAELLEHRAFLSVGHDEYWSAGQRANVEAARAAGVHLGIFSGNEGFWKTRWEPSIDGSGTANRTLVCYKETHANAKIDPLPGVWTGTWRDPRFLPHDGNRPENALNGTIFSVNGIRNDALEVPAADGKMRFWRNTSIASLAAGQVATLPAGVLGFEWDEDLDNGSRPPGLVRLSTTTVAGVPLLQDYGSTYASGTATHRLTLYRHASGSLVFGAGTIQWAWGLDDQHDRPGTPADARMQQATVNLFADMGVQAVTLQAGLVAASASTDSTAPSAVITAPTNGATIALNTPVTISGTASDVGGQVGAVEVSTDGGATWHPANGRATWTYAWLPTASGSATLRARAADDSGNLGAASPAVTVTVAVPTLTSIAVSPANPTVTVGGTQQFTATGTYSDASTQNLTSQVTWASSATGVAAVNAAGLATAASAGTTTISATLGAVSGSTLLTVSPGPLTITTAALPGGTPAVAYSATLAASGGTPPYTWSLASGTLPAGLSLAAGTGVISGTPTATGTSNFTVRVTAGAQNTTKALSIIIASATKTIWASSTVPSIVDSGPDSAVNLGVKFRSDSAGTITGIRFYKSAPNTGTHVGALWSSAGTLLASATFSGESGSGWQQVTFSSPVAITANTVYVASYLCPNGHYSVTLNYFTNGFDNPPLHALANGVSGGNGLYAYGAANAFPANTFNAANYWVDVVFSSAPAPTLTSIAVTPANSTATVGGTRQFTATGTYSDASTQNLSSQVTWASSATGVATINAAGIATALSAGPTTISATLGSVSGNTVLTATAPPTLTSIAVSPANPTVTVGATQQFTATGTYSDASTQNLTSQVTWASSASGVAAVNAAGLATAASAGTTTISATLGAVSGSTLLTVSPGPLTITTAALPGGTPAVAYSATLAASGGTPPYTWSLASGTLPAGLSLAAGTGVISGTPTATGTSNFTVRVTAGAQNTTKALSIIIASATQTIWASSTVPSIVDAGPDSAVNLGVKFRSDTAGFIRGIRFYKSTLNTGTHVGALWSSTGTLLASATFSGESGSGWQQVMFSSPVAIAANTVYVASYRCPNGHYSGNSNYFTTGVDNVPLHALADGVSGGNGVYAYGATNTFPVNSYNAANYWVDVVFSPTP